MIGTQDFQTNLLQILKSDPRIRNQHPRLVPCANFQENWSKLLRYNGRGLQIFILLARDCPKDVTCQISPLDDFIR